MTATATPVTQLQTVSVAVSAADVARLAARGLAADSGFNPAQVAALATIRRVLARFAMGDVAQAAALWTEDRYERVVDPVRGDHILIQEGEAVIGWLFSGDADRLDHALKSALYLASW